jgi:4a-hydroxytetrahydrobiopterin dehydratase
VSSPSFREIDGALQAEWTFPDYQAAFAFVASLAFLAEKLQHHPALWWDYRTIRVQLSTHDAGGKITEKDRQLAAAIEALVALKS